MGNCFGASGGIDDDVDQEERRRQMAAAAEKRLQNDKKKTLEDWTLEDLYLCPGFFGELTIENAKEIVKEAFQNDETSEGKGILFLKVRKFQNQIFSF